MVQFKIPQGIECPDWEPLPDSILPDGSCSSKACRYYLKPDPTSGRVPRGLCQLPKNFSCIEWDRRNPHLVRPTRPVSSPKAVETVAPVAQAPRQATLPSLGTLRDADSSEKVQKAPKRSVGVSARELPYSALPEFLSDVLVSVTPEQIERLRKAQLEVCLRSDEPTIGELWLVPKKTGRDRMELTFEEAATIRMIADVFPGARVVGLRKAPHDADDE
jgi:hypothetical protein